MIESCTAEYIGLIEYRKALELQRKYHLEVKNEVRKPVILFCEHVPVITLGRRGGQEFIRAGSEELMKRGISIVETERGGLVTLHLPGQLVIYPILPVAETAAHGSVKLFVSLLLNSLSDWLDRYGVKAELDLEYPGLWVNKQKIAAVGLRIKDKVSYHGMALNISPDLSLFDLIVPCGISNRDVTSLAALTGKSVGIEQAAKEITEHLSLHLNLPNIEYKSCE